jgi:hypothetical protein
MNTRTAPTAIATTPARGLMKTVCGRSTSQAKNPNGPTTCSVVKYVTLRIMRAITPNTMRINPPIEKGRMIGLLKEQELETIRDKLFAPPGKFTRA